VTLLNGKVSTRLGDQQLLARFAPPKNPQLSAGSKRKGHALVDSENI
jgi:hypothetical protein